MEPTLELTTGQTRLIVFVTSLSLFNFGYNTASISGALLYIDRENFDCSSHPVCLDSSFVKGCVVSSCLVGAMFGALAAGSLADLFGRKTVLLVNNFFYIAGPVGMALAPSVGALVVARAVAGIGVGISSALVHVYISEIVPAEKRGEHGAILVMMGTGGILLSIIAAWALGSNWRVVLGLAVIPAMVQALTGITFLPESPRWLSTRERRRLLMRVVPDSAVLSPGEGQDMDGGWGGLVRAIRSGQAKQAMIIGSGLQIFQQISGINVAVYYGPKIFTLAHFSNQEAILLSACVSVGQIAATLLLARVVDRVGRRPMCFLGLAVMVVSLAALGAAFWLLRENPDGNFAGWIALASVLIYRVAFSISLGPMPYIITAEIFPGSCRASGVSLCWGINWASNFVVSLTFLPLMNFLSTSGIFWLYAGVCVLAIWFVRAQVPETSGQTLEEIDQGGRR